jgi:hypothetical protein
LDENLDEKKSSLILHNNPYIAPIIDLNQTPPSFNLAMIARSNVPLSRSRHPDSYLNPIIDNPFAVFAIALVAQWCAAFAGDLLRRKIRPLKKDEREDFDTVLAASLTLLALIIGFSFSMAVSRYDQRKNYEEAEANAIGTEYLRADLLSTADAAKVRQFLRLYVDQRIDFYRKKAASPDIGNDVKTVQDELWSTVVRAGAAQPNPVLTLTVAGMNDVFNTQADTRAAWLNRIPTAAWALMILIAIFSNILLGYRDRSSGSLALLVLPVIASIAFFLIADIDSPYSGVISVVPQNLLSTFEGMKQ